MAARRVQDAQQAAADNLLAFFESRMAASDDIELSVEDHINKVSIATTADIRPNVFLIAPNRTNNNSDNALKPDSADADEEGVEAARQTLNLRSGTAIERDDNVDDADMGKDADESDVDDVDEVAAEAQDLDYGNDSATHGGDSDLESDRATDDALSVRETHVVVDGCPQPIPVSEYFGREYTQHIVGLLEAEPIQQPATCYTQLKEWQLSGVGKLKYLFDSQFKGGILGDEQGLGKTLTAITAMVEEIIANKGKPYRGFNLIITTKSCAPQWVEEIRQHYGQDMVKKAFILNDPKIAANELLDAEYEFVLCTWQFVANRYAAFEKNLNFFNLLYARGHEWITQKVARPERMPLDGRHINALFSHVYAELDLPIKHLVLDEAQYAKNSFTQRYHAISHLRYERVLLLSGTFVANRWHDLFGLVSLIPGHPFTDYQQFMKTFAHREMSGHYSEPTTSKRDRLIKFLMAFTISRPVSILHLPRLHREFHDFMLDSNEEGEVAYWVEKYLMLMSKNNRQQVFQQSSAAADNHKAALLKAVLAQQSCANGDLFDYSQLSEYEHFLAQSSKLQERFKSARDSADGELTLEELLALVMPLESEPREALALEVSDEMYNESLVQDQGEAAEIDGDVPEVITNGEVAYDPNRTADNDSSSSDENDDEDNHQIYKALKPGEDRKDWLRRLRDMDKASLHSSKVVAILRLMFKLSQAYPKRKIVVFSKFLKFLDMLDEAIHRDDAFVGVIPLRFNGNLSSEQRAYSQNTFNNSTINQPLFITAGSGGAGMNLTGGSLIIQCEPWWNVHDELQAQSRCWRLGQELEVYVYVMRGTNSLIDYIIHECQNRKKATNTQIMTPLRREDNEAVIIPKQYGGGVGEA